MRNIDSLPNLDGYLTTTAKPRADVAIVSDEDDPILASWQYGLGKVVAFTSDFEGKWSKDFIGSNEAARLWLNSLSYVLPSSQSEDFIVDTKRDGDKGMIIAKFKDEGRFMDARATIISPDGSMQEIDLHPVKPGEYKGEFEVESQGIYAINVVDTQISGAIESVDTALAVAYSPEYDIRDRQGIDLLERISYITGGKLVERPEDIFRDEGGRIWKREELDIFILPFILMLFILDIALRRIDIRVRRREIKRPILIQAKEPKDKVQEQFTSHLLKARRGRKKF
ncbi:MAG: hypothetical protein GX974_08135 [Clostridiales bacterium]|nr:hypothetical protein [Clostridiales bacterium]